VALSLQEKDTKDTLSFSAFLDDFSRNLKEKRDIGATPKK
jgi:hypothetical protein